MPSKMTRDDFRSLHSPVQYRGGHCNFTLRGLMKELAGDSDMPPVNLDPPYQRQHVWTREQQERFVGHFLEGGAIPDFVFRRDPTSSGIADEVVDGKQRLTALSRWMKGEINAELTDGRGVNINDFDEDARGAATGTSGPNVSINYGYWTDVQVMRLYVRLNRGGTVHTDDEINRVRAMLAAEELAEEV